MKRLVLGGLAFVAVVSWGQTQEAPPVPKEDPVVSQLRMIATRLSFMESLLKRVGLSWTDDETDRFCGIETFFDCAKLRLLPTNTPQNGGVPKMYFLSITFTGATKDPAETADLLIVVEMADHSKDSLLQKEKPVKRRAGSGQKYVEFDFMTLDPIITVLSADVTERWVDEKGAPQSAYRRFR